MSNIADSENKINFEDTLLDTSELTNDQLERNALNSISNASNTSLTHCENRVRVTDYQRRPLQSDFVKPNQKIFEMKSRMGITSEYDDDDDNDDTDSFASCSDNLNGHQFPRPPSIITIQKAMQQQTPTNRTKSTKNFTISVFVDSIDNYSYGDSSSSRSSSSTSSINKSSHVSPDSNQPFKCDHELGCKVDCAFNYRCAGMEKNINDYAYVMNELVQLGSLTASSNQDDDYQKSSSSSPGIITKEFEFQRNYIDGKPIVANPSDKHADNQSTDRHGKSIRQLKETNWPE